MRVNLWVVTSFCLVFSYGFTTDQKGASPQEALVIKRITEYWKDKDFSTVKKQIINFLVENPTTILKDYLQAMLGDIYMQEKNYSKALELYEAVKDQEIEKKILLNKLQAYFESKQYLKVVATAEEFLKQPRQSQEEEAKIRYLLAEAFFRQAFSTENLDEKINYLKRAKPHYKILTKTKYAERTLFPLAEIYRTLKEDQKAASLYLLLADKYPDHQEKFLFQAAILLLKDSPEEAINAFSKIVEKGGTRAHLAGYNLLLLLYQSERHQDYIALYPKIIDSLPKEKAPLLQFYLGRSHYALQNFKAAATELENFSKAAGNRTKELRIALLLLVNCARQLKQENLLENSISTFETNFPNAEELPKAIFIRAQLFREKGNIQQSLEDLKKILVQFPSFEEREAVLYEYGILLFHAKQWHLARETFSTFIREYPNSEQNYSSWRYLLNSCIEQLNDPVFASSKESKEAFIEVLETVLKHKEVLNEKEKQQYQIILAKCFFEVGKFDRTVSLLEEHIRLDENATSSAEAHLFLGLSLQKMNNDPNSFVLHGEKALELNPELPEKEILHLELFNSYLTIALSEKNPLEKEKFFDQAANHLYLSKGWESKTIKLDNFIWLSNYYYLKSKNNPDDQLSFQRAMSLYTHLLGIQDVHSEIQISSDSLFLEHEIVKFTDLLSMKKETEKEILFLEKLVRKQQELAQLPWKTQKKAILQLAKAYEKAGRSQNAIQSYEYLITTSDNLYSKTTNIAQLCLAKLEFRLMKEEEKNIENPKLVSILHSLKDLQIQKKISNEPIHLEAALTYAEIRSYLAEEGIEKIKSSIFFLKRMKEDFNSSEDLIAQNYHKSRGELLEKDKIFKAYMQFIDAKISYFQAALIDHEKREGKAVEFRHQAASLIADLFHHKENLQPYLLERVEKMRSEMEKTL
ncbi:MAG: tetratricopeptide repeat protein [Chlamydiae bacterium]|nr:tetratricopeptide repeat protein [Chlamydiota bacterium]